ncbi:MAG: protein translocase subunit SecD [Alphaproteobacteria bacterium]|nr:protein translocase subunit SecD [Alphaproteobacteria bacterium]MDE2513715.1 protein translocase subunit SecD [Alphaproteobacteria bacterium]
MLYFQTWKIALILAVCALGVIFTLPNAFTTATVESWPSFLPRHQVSLGLDLRGGSYLLLEVDTASVERDRLNSLVDELRTAMIANHVGYTNLGAAADHVAVKLTDASKYQEVHDAVAKFDPDLQFASASDGTITLKPTPEAVQARQRSAVDQSIEIVRRRIDETGTREATIQREGDKRILVELPGISNPERVKALLGKTARLTFQMVDPNASADEARAGRVPPGDEFLSAAETRPGLPTGYVLRRRVLVSGDMLTDAQPTFQENEPVVSFKFDSVGARRFAEATKENVGKLFAIVLDNKVISAPVIREPILGGQGVISGSFTVQSASDLALLLRAGALPAPLTVIEERSVGPDLGADSIREGTTASIVGVALVVVFMVVFYGLFGLFADVALFFNLCIMMAALTLLGATLTLPGIAGIALTMGMAVDANVLIYERIREEVRGGRSLISSLQAGFERAFGTILDSHVTTLVAGALMFWLGSGPVKGFAVTLSLGVLTSLFSAILVTRLQIVTWLRRFKPKVIPI